jgi:hypothetical protein
MATSFVVVDSKTNEIKMNLFDGNLLIFDTYSRTTEYLSDVKNEDLNDVKIVEVEMSFKIIKDHN